MQSNCKVSGFEGVLIINGLSKSGKIYILNDKNVDFDLQYGSFSLAATGKTSTFYLAPQMLT